MAEGAAAAAIVGTGIQIYGSAQEAKEKKRVLMAQQQSRNEQAMELMDRYEINAKSLEKDFEKYKAGIEGAVVKSGWAMSGSPLLAMEQAVKDFHEQQYMNRREAYFSAEQMRREGQFIGSQIRPMEQAARLQQAGYFMQGASQVGSAYASRSGGSQKPDISGGSSSSSQTLRSRGNSIY